MNTQIMALLVAAPFLGSAVVADDIEKKTAQTEAQFRALDRDGDQRISESEARSERKLAQRFAAVDSNGDGYLSVDEYMARPSGEPFE